VFQQVPIAVAILLDRSPRPVFPRWVGYLNLWVPLSCFPAFLIYFFKSRPLAWQGILVFYLGLATFGAWEDAHIKSKDLVERFILASYYL
jgi:hypothetical protein